MRPPKTMLTAALMATLHPCAATATTYNVAPMARVTASSCLDDSHSAACATDGIVRTRGMGEWRSDARMKFWGEIDFPWLQLDWDEPQEIAAVTLYDTAGDDATCSGGELVFDDGSRVLVRGIPAGGAPKTVTFSPRLSRSLRFEVTDGDGDCIGLSELEVYTTPTDCVTAVDPYIETTRGRYFFFVTGSQPFGMIGAAPLTRNKNQGGGGYNYNATEVLAFPQIHGWMLGGLELMPVTGTVDADRGRQAWKSAFTHDGEVVQPAYHRLYLERYDTWVEQTCTDRTSLYRLSYTRDARASLLINLGGFSGNVTMVNAHWQPAGPDAIEGHFDTTGRLWGGPDRVRVFFVTRFSQPFDTLTTFGTFTEHATPRNEGMSYADAPPYGARAHFDVKAGDRLLVRTSISYTSADDARRNMEAEADGWDFDAVRRASQQEWNDMLGRIVVEGGTPEDRTKFYTDLWHVLLGRHKTDDASGHYPTYPATAKQPTRRGYDARLQVRSLSGDGPLGPKTRGASPRHMYNSDALWLTMWNLNTLWGLAWPDMLDDFAASMLQHSLDQGLLPRGPCAGGYTWIMSGCPATSLITSAYQRGICRRFSPQAALREMVRNHLPGGMMAWGQDDDLRFYEQHGYVPDQAGLTIQWCFEDWALAQMAQKMGRRHTARRFARRASGWAALMHPTLRLLLPRTRDGQWLHTDPLSGWGYEEANAWQATFGVSHDLPRLACLMGGADTLCAMLDHAFTQAQATDFMSEYGRGYVNYGNQPSLSNAHVFAHAGRADLTHRWVQRVRRQTYGGTTPDKGYGGHDEDQGQMGALSALMSIGLFAIDGGSAAEPRYDITPPLFDRVTLRLHPLYCKGSTFTIVAHADGPVRDHIVRATLDGRPLDSFSLSHADLSRGGTLELWLE